MAKNTKVYTAQKPTVIERIYTYHSVNVAIRINFKDKTVSLVEKDTHRENTEVKKWVFTGRGLEYMEGWQLILDGMKYAIGEATKELKEYVDKEKVEEAELIDAVIKERKKENG